MLKTPLIWLFLFGCALSITFASLEIIQPLHLREWWTSNPDLTYESIAQFGDIPWGGFIQGQIRLANPIDACSTIQTGNTGGSVPAILIAVRGECPFALKARYAEEAGAKLLLIVDNQYEDVRTKLMVDNSGGSVPIHIASVLISKQGGDKLIEAVKESESGAFPVRGKYRFASSTQESVNYHLWLLNGEKNSFEFLQDFKQYYDKFSPLATMEIHFPTFINEPSLDCTCQGRYCTLWQNDGLFKSGTEVIMENVKQLCIIELFGQDTWWDYVAEFAKSCLNSQDTAKCSESVIQKTQIPSNSLNSCVTESFVYGSQGCESNSLLDQEVVARDKDTPFAFPGVIINGLGYRGNMIPAKGVFSAICQSFNMMPEICDMALNPTESNITLPFPLTNTSEPPKVPSPEEIVKALPPGTLPNLPTSYQGNPSGPYGSETASSRQPTDEPSSQKDGSGGGDNVTITISKTNLVIVLAVVFCVIFALVILFLHRRSIKRLEASMQANQQKRGANLPHAVMPYTVIGNNPPEAEAHSSSYQA